MSLSLVLVLQAAAIPGPAAPASAPQHWTMPAPSAREIPPDFDLARFEVPGGDCTGTGAGDVVVCGRRRGGAGDYPLAQWARIFTARPIRAEMNLGGGVQGRIHAEAVPMDRGAVSNRVMIGIRTRF